jgi:hypothetical protein
MAVRKPKNIWKIPHIIYKNTHDYSLLQWWRIVVTHHRWWLEKNPHLQPPDGCCGVFHWGTWPELGKKNGPILPKDAIKGGTRSNPQDGAYAMRYRMETMKSLGPLTKAIDLLFQIVDKRTRDVYHAAFDLLSPGATVYSTKYASEELFPLRAILINSLTEEHIDPGNWKGGWAWIGVFGKFTGGNFCLSQLVFRYSCRLVP